ncbi:ATP-binding cassette domain-containing protein [Holdemania massiliensis]|uniref:ATP-binding cassette domain-containing protein n=1 Tax=Holdemania massiliensis TaxID=1468449 RepID=UPI001F05CFEE|nr:ATP-binding cassette domain-containing protein [Holdemania massiliensis]MCH1942722.1 ATP-binding cassette domain-containing protein [Holdemania massiliensis]
MTTQRIAIQADHLSKSYQKASVLNDIHFSVESGTIFSLLGSNGAGKTTTVKILTTLIQPEGGQFYIHGYDGIQQPGKIHEMISLTGQFSAVDEALTGFENLVLIGKLHHLPNPAEKANELLAYFNLTPASNRCVSTYSGGMRRKLDIAMSLINKPAVLFLDEPTTGLDPQSRHAMWEIIRNLKKAGTTIFLTTQYLEEAEQLADNLAILDKGKIIVEGTLDDLKKLLPQEKVELTFADEAEYEKARTFLSADHVVSDRENLRITIYTQDAPGILTQLFQQIASHHLEIKDFSRKSPSLEDVFLTLVGEKETAAHE